MKQQILAVDKLQNLVNWFGRNFVCGVRPSNVRVLYMFANKVDTPADQDGNTKYSKFYNEDEAAEYLEALENTAFIIESELVDQDPIKDDESGEVIHVAETWKITTSPSMNNTDDRFVTYCSRPYRTTAI